MAKLGTKKRPVRFRVQTEERLQEIALLCDKNGWIFVGEFEPDEPEDLCEVEYLLNPQAFTSQPRMGNADNMTVVYKKHKVGRNAPCPCGSGKKYKKCCLGKSDAPVMRKRDELDLLMQEGYSLLHKNKTAKACNLWLELWSKLKIRFKPEFKNVKEAETIFSGEELVYNWCQDLEAELGNAAIDDPSYYQIRIEYCNDFCSIFSESDSLLIHNMKRAIAESHLALGDISKGDECFTALIEEYPKNIWGYIGWGDMYLWPMKKDTKPDYEKAENIYKMTMGMELGDESDLIDRLEELKIKRVKTI